MAEIEPRPAVEAAGLDAADVIGHQPIPQLVALIHAHPEVAGARTELDPDRIPDPPRINFPAGAVGVELEDAGAVRFARVIRNVLVGADGDVHLFAVGREGEVAGPMAAAMEQPAAGELRA